VPDATTKAKNHQSLVLTHNLDYPGNEDDEQDNQQPNGYHNV
jgi:hypothetical protein